MDRFLAKKNYTSDVGWSFLYVLEIHIIQFVNGHNTNDASLLGSLSILCFFFLGVADDGELPWLVITYLFFLSSVANDGELGVLLSFLR